MPVNRVNKNIIPSFMSSVANSTDTLRRTSSVILASGNVATEVLQAFFDNCGHIIAQIKAINAPFAATKSLIDATSFIGRGAQWIDPHDRKDLLQSKAKTLKMLTLTAGQCMNTIAFVDKLSYRFFSQTACCIGRNLPVFNLVKDSFFAASAGIGIYIGRKSIVKSHNLIDVAARRRRKWKLRSLIMSNYQENLLNKLKLKYALKKEQTPEKEQKYNAYLLELSKNSSEETWKQFQEKQKNKIIAKLKDVINREFSCDTLAKLRDKLKEMNTHLRTERNKFDVLRKKYKQPQSKTERNTLRQNLITTSANINQFAKKKAKAVKYAQYIEAIEKGEMKKLCQYKVEEIHEVRMHNHKLNVCKSQVGIAADLGKIFIITVSTIMGLATAFFGFSAIPILSAPAVCITMASLGLAVSSLGLAKNIYRDVIVKCRLLDPVEFAGYTPHAA